MSGVVFVLAVEHRTSSTSSAASCSPNQSTCVCGFVEGIRMYSSENPVGGTAGVWGAKPFDTDC